MYVKVWVKTGAKREVMAATSADHFDIAVKEEPVQNLANRRVIALVAAHYHVPVKGVRIISGHRSPSKLLAITTRDGG